MYSQQPYLNGPRHTYLDLSVKNVNPRLLNRILDRFMDRETHFRNLEPPSLTFQHAIPNIVRRQVDITRARLAFGPGAMPKLRRELHHNDNHIVKQALNSLADMVHDPKRTFQAINLKIIDRIKDMLVCDDHFMRERTAMILATIASQSLGREAILKDPSYIKNIVSLLSDRLPDIRLHATLALELLTRNYNEGIDDNWLLPIFVNLLYEEEDGDLLAMHLQIIQYLLNRNTKKLALEIGAIGIMENLMNENNSDICAGALACIALITDHPDGRKMGMDIDILGKVRPKLYDDRYEVHFNAATVVMFNTLTTPSKFRALEVDLIDRLLLLAANDKCPQLQLHCLKGLTNICEVPKGRSILLQHQDTIEAIRTGDFEFIKRAVATLLSVIRWTP